MRPLIFFIFFLVISGKLLAQSPIEEIQIDVVFRKAPLANVFKTIQEKYHVKIAYDYSLVQNFIVDVHVKGVNFSQWLELLLKETPLTFHMIGDNVVIVPRPAAITSVREEKKDFKVSGIVQDAGTNETLPQAFIHVKGTDLSTTSNQDGYFTMLQVPSDTCQLEVRYLGYITQTIRVSNIQDLEKLTIHMKSDTEILNEIVVLDEYNQAVHLDDQPGTIAFNPRSLASLPSLGEQDISRTMQLLPGISATDESSAGMVIRGSHSSYNLTLLDGMTIYQQDHFFGSFSIINADIIKDIRVHKGMFDPKFGGRVSGVVDITSKNGNTVKPAFNVKLNMINVKGTLEIPLAKKWSLFMGARRSFTDVVQTKLFNSLFSIARNANDQIELFRFLDRSGRDYYFFDVNTKLTFRPSDRDVLSLSLYASRDKMLISDSTTFGDVGDKFLIEDEELNRWGNNGLSFRWARQWNDRYYSNFRISDSKFFKKYLYQQNTAWDMGRSAYSLGFDHSIRDLTYAIDNEWMLRDNLSFNWGVSGVKQQTGFHMYDQYEADPPLDEMPEDINTTESDHSWQHAIYGSMVLSPVSRLLLTGGGRFVYYTNQVSLLLAEPRLTTQYKVTDQWAIKAGYARSSQFVTQLFYYSPMGSISGISENYWMLSNPDDVRYPVITFDHVSGGVTLKKPQYIYDVEFYHRAGSGVILDENLNSGNIQVYGMDVMIQKASGIHRGWIAYTLSRATQTHPYIQSGREISSWQDQRHEFKAVDMLMLGNWNISSTVIFGSGKPYAKYDVRYLRNQNNEIYYYALQLDYSNPSRLPVYFRIDLAVSYQIQLRKLGKLELALSIHNVTDHQNIKTRMIDTDRLDEAIFLNTELPAVYKDVVLLGFMPTFSVSFSF